MGAQAIHQAVAGQPADAEVEATQRVEGRGAQPEADTALTQAMHEAVAGQPADAQAEAMQQVEGRAAQPGADRVLKRPKTAFWLFQEEMREGVAREIGSTQSVLVVSALAAKWKSLDGAARAVYTDRAKGLMEQYRRDLANGAAPAQALAQGGAARPGRSGRAPRMGRALLRRGAAAPKRPRTSYAIWLAENRCRVAAELRAEGVAEPTFEEVARAAGRAWSALTPEQKAPFVERARALGEKYRRISAARKEYKKANTEDLRSRLTARARAARARAARAAAGRRAAAERRRAAGAAGTPEQEAGAQDTPKKRTSSASQTATSSKKAARKAPAPNPTAVRVDAALEAEAEKLGMAGSFRRLVERGDMARFAQRSLLDALVASRGLLHRAREGLLAAAA